MAKIDLVSKIKEFKGRRNKSGFNPRKIEFIFDDLVFVNEQVDKVNSCKDFINIARSVSCDYDLLVDSDGKEKYRVNVYFRYNILVRVLMI